MGEMGCERRDVAGVVGGGLGLDRWVQQSECDAKDVKLGNRKSGPSFSRFLGAGASTETHRYAKSSQVHNLTCNQIYM